MRGLEEREIAKLGEHPPQLRLKNHQHRHGEKAEERRQQPAQDLQLKDAGDQRQRQHARRGNR